MDALRVTPQGPEPRCTNYEGIKSFILIKYFIWDTTIKNYQQKSCKKNIFFGSSRMQYCK